MMPKKAKSLGIADFAEEAGNFFCLRMPGCPLPAGAVVRAG